MSIGQVSPGFPFKYGVDNLDIHPKLPSQVLAGHRLGEGADLSHVLLGQFCPRAWMRSTSTQSSFTRRIPNVVPCCPQPEVCWIHAVRPVAIVPRAIVQDIQSLGNGTLGQFPRKAVRPLGVSAIGRKLTIASSPFTAGPQPTLRGRGQFLHKGPEPLSIRAVFSLMPRNLLLLRLSVTVARTVFAPPLHPCLGQIELFPTGLTRHDFAALARLSPAMVRTKPSAFARSVGGYRELPPARFTEQRDRLLTCHPSTEPRTEFPISLPQQVGKNGKLLLARFTDADDFFWSSCHVVLPHKPAEHCATRLFSRQAGVC